MVVQDPENDAKYRCAECNLQFGTPRDLSRHLNKTARHGGQPSPCAICHKPLTRPDSRARHERRCRERFGVTEEMWQGIERERQRGRRKSISVDGTDEANRLAGDIPGMGCDHAGREHGSGPSSGSSRSRTVSVSEVSDATELAAAFASARVASSAPTPITAARFVSQPGEPRRRSTSLRTPHHPLALSSKEAPMNGLKRRDSSPHSRGVLSPPPPPHARGSPMTTHWRPLNRLSHQARDDSPPFDPPSSPVAMQDESDSEPMVPMSAYRSQTRWTTLEDEEVDELAEDDEDEAWLQSASPRAHNNHMRAPEGTMGPPPKKKLLGFESSGGGLASWSPHKTQR